MIVVFAEITVAAGATVATGCGVLLATVTLGCDFVATFIEHAFCEFATVAVVAVAVTLPLSAAVPADSVVDALLTVVVIGFVLGIKVDRAEFGLEPAGSTAAILPDVVVVVVKLNGFACVLSTVAAAGAGAAAVVLGVA